METEQRGKQMKKKREEENETRLGGFSFSTSATSIVPHRCTVGLPTRNRIGETPCIQELTDCLAYGFEKASDVVLCKNEKIIICKLRLSNRVSISHEFLIGIRDVK